MVRARAGAGTHTVGANTRRRLLGRGNAILCKARFSPAFTKKAGPLPNLAANLFLVAELRENLS